MLFGSWFIVSGQSNASIGIILYIKVKERKEEVAVAELKLSNMTRSSRSKTKTAIMQDFDCHCQELKPEMHLIHGCFCTIPVMHV